MIAPNVYCQLFHYEYTTAVLAPSDPFKECSDYRRKSLGSKFILGAKTDRLRTVFFPDFCRLETMFVMGSSRTGTAAPLVIVSRSVFTVWPHN